MSNETIQIEKVKSFTDALGECVSASHITYWYRQNRQYIDTENHFFES